MQKISFDKISEHYDDSRDVPTKVIQGLIDHLHEVGVFRENRLIVDVACGTCRYLEPFASTFTHAIGLDISEEMIDISRRKCKGNGSVHFFKGDARFMGISGDVADVVMASKLFIHIRQWKDIIAEIKRITSEGGYFIHITETGLFNNNIRKKFRGLCRQAKMNFGFLGEADPEKVGQWIEEIGYHRINIPDQNFNWDHQVAYAEAYEALKNRSFVEFQQINDSDYQTILDSTAEWILDQPKGWDEIQEMHARLRVDVFQKTG